jgi:hypothetical protein
MARPARSARPARRTKLLVALVLLAASAACKDRRTAWQAVDASCFDAGTCDCRTSADCPAARPTCVDARCVGPVTVDPTCVPTAEVCNGRDDDCDGQIDEGLLASDPNCGACGNDCTQRFDAATQHAVGVCDAANALAPDCAIAACLEGELGGATLCVTDADCGADPIATVCDPVLKACLRACPRGDECGPGATCVAGQCATPCGGDPDCVALHGAGSTCAGGTCRRHVAWKDVDGSRVNGCECGAFEDDEPLTFAARPAAPGAPTVDRNCDGMEGDAARALFVAPGGAGVGSRAAPLGSIQAAVDAFDPALHRHVVVAGGTYEEAVTLRPGVRIYGGYGPDFRERDVVLHRTVIQAPAPAPLASGPVAALSAVGITTTTVVAGFTLQGWDAAGAGEGRSTSAVYLAASSDQLRLVNDEIVAGRGGRGAAGAPGAEGATGGDGGDGGAARECSAPDCRTGNESTAGGLAGTNAQCAGSAGCPGMEADGADVQVSEAPLPGCGYGTGGAFARYLNGDPSFCKYDCALSASPSGTSGAAASPPGTAGVGGAGCAAPLGSLVAGAWVPGSADAGTVGASGAGGQGGAAGGTVRNSKSATCVFPVAAGNLGDVGGSGGGGGAGGCGGAGGLAGGSGGASIAVLVASGSGGSHPVISGCVIALGEGGAGGDGGAGGAGGLAGRGGAGGTSSTTAWCAGLGGAGGDGAAGSDGGGGGGGCGGPSFGVAGVGIPDYAGAALHNEFHGGAGGAGGDGGPAPYAGATGPGAAGTQGARAHVQSF